MTATWLPVLAALVGTLAGVAATYVVAKRRSSGRIATSEAADLWQASESIRHDLTEDVKALRMERASESIRHDEDLKALRTEMASLRAENIALLAEIAAIRSRIGD